MSSFKITFLKFIDYYYFALFCIFMKCIFCIFFVILYKIMGKCHMRLYKVLYNLKPWFFLIIHLIRKYFVTNHFIRKHSVRDLTLVCFIWLFKNYISHISRKKIKYYFRRWWIWNEIQLSEKFWFMYIF